MKIRITARELHDRGLWIQYCELTGTNEWAMAEGLMDSSEELTIEEAVAVRLGLVKDPLESDRT